MAAAAYSLSDFNELRSMFSNLSEEVISIALSTNNGDMQLATEQLLAESLNEGQNNANQSDRAQDMTGRTAVNHITDTSTTISGSNEMREIQTKSMKPRGKPIKLPDNFLRVPNFGGYGGVRSAERAQVEADKEIAAALQNADYLNASRDHDSYARGSVFSGAGGVAYENSAFPQIDLNNITNRISALGNNVRNYIQRAVDRSGTSDQPQESTIVSSSIGYSSLPQGQRSVGHSSSFDQPQLTARHSSEQRNQEPNSYRSQELIDLSDPTASDSKKDM